MDLLWKYRWVAAEAVLGLVLVAAGILAGVHELWVVGVILLAPAYFLALAVAVGMLLFGVVKAIQWALATPTDAAPALPEADPDEPAPLGARSWPFPRRRSTVDREPRCLGPAGASDVFRDDASNDARFSRRL